MSETLIGGSGEGGAPGAGEGGAPPSDDWRAQLPEEYRGHTSLKDIQDLPSLAKSYIHAQSLIGQDKIILPKDPNDKDSWSEVYNKLGRPESPEGYEFKKPESPEYEQVSYDEDLMKEASAKMHELGLSKSQAQAIHAWWNSKGLEADVASRAFAKKELDDTTASLKSEWGPQFDENLASAKQAVMQFGGPELAKYLEETGMGNNINLVKTFLKVAQQVSGDRLHTGNNTSSFGGESPQSALKKITELNNNKDFMAIYQDRYHHGHKAAVAQMQELFKVAYNT